MIALLLACTAPQDDSATTAPGCEDDQVLEGTRCLSEACGVGVWGNLPSDATHVDPFAPDGGDGSRDRPYNSLTAALQSHSDLVLAEGRYVGGFAIRRDTRIQGRCPQLVTLTAVDESVLYVEETSLDLRDVSIRGGKRGIDTHDADVTATNVHLLGVGDFAIATYGGSLHVDGVLIQDPTPNAHHEGVGVLGLGSGQLTGQDLTIVGGAVGLEVEMVVDLTRLDISGLEDQGAGPPVGIVAGNAGITCTDCRIHDHPNIGVYASSSSVFFHDSVISGITSLPNGTAHGIYADAMADVRLYASTVEDIEGDAVRAVGEFTLVRTEDAVIRDVRPSPVAPAVALRLQDGATSYGELLVVEGAPVVCQGGAWRPQTVEIHAVVPGLTFGDGGFAGPAVLATDGCVAEVKTAALLDGADTFGLVVQGTGTEFTMRGSVVNTVGDNPVDVLVQDGGLLRLTGVEVAGPHHGLLVADARVLAEDVVLPASDGVGVVVQDNATFRGENLTVTGRTGWAIGAALDSELELIDSQVTDTVRDQDRSLATAVGCESSLCILSGVHVQNTQGIGVASEGDAALLFLDGTVTDSVLAGLFAGPDGHISCSNSTVRGGAIEDTVGVGVGFGVVQGTADLSGCDVSGGAHAAVWVADGDADITDSVLVGGPRQQALGNAVHGDALISDHSDTSVTGGSLQGADGAGLLVLGAAPALDSVAFDDNALDIRHQECADPMSPPIGVDALICPEAEELVLELDFYNAVRLEDVQ